mgnify:CR=1 FL=1
MSHSSYDNDNIFAKILRGEIPNDTVYEDENVLAFNDINPQAPVHIVVIPKGKYTTLEDFVANAGDAEITGFYRAVGQIAREKGLDAEGYRTLTNSGDHAGQEVPHFHLHILGGRPLGPMLAR